VDDGGVASSPPPYARTQDAIPCDAPSLATRPRPQPLIERLLALLDLQPDDLLVQLGCAFPSHLLALTQRVPLRYQALVVDPSKEQLARFVGMPMLRCVTMDPLRFAAYPMLCDRILLEDTLLRGDSRARLARGLLSRLRPAGRVLAVGAIARPEAEPVQERRGLVAPSRTSADGAARVLEDAGFEVRRDAARLGNARIDLVLGTKTAP